MMGRPIWRLHADEKLPVPEKTSIANLTTK